MRPARTKHTKERRDLAMALYATSGSYRHAARESGAPEATIRRWVREDPEGLRRLESKACDAIGERVRNLLAMAVTHAARRLEDNDEPLSLLDSAKVVQALASAAGRMADMAQARAWLAKEMAALVKRIGDRDPELLRRVVAHIERHEPALSESM